MSGGVSARSPGRQNGLSARAASSRSAGAGVGGGQREIAGSAERPQRACGLEPLGGDEVVGIRAEQEEKDGVDRGGAQGGGGDERPARPKARQPQRPQRTDGG